MREIIAGALVGMDGVMQAPGGPVRTGSFALESRTGAELERRRNLTGGRRSRHAPAASARHTLFRPDCLAA